MKTEFSEGSSAAFFGHLKNKGQKTCVAVKGQDCICGGGGEDSLQIYFHIWASVEEKKKKSKIKK